MRDVIILGTGRSGTSVTASLFRNTGAFRGNELYKHKTLANPNGYFEDFGITRINNCLVQRVVRFRLISRLPNWMVPPTHVDSRSLWLAAPRRISRRAVPDPIARQMRDHVSRRPFCYKDPRFSVTLPLWGPFLPENTRFLVVFREPERTVQSMLRDVNETYDPPLPLTERQAYVVWCRTYWRLLYTFVPDERWMFVSYNDVIGGKAIPAIERFTSISVDASLVDPKVSRVGEDGSGGTNVPRRCRRLYDALVARSKRDLGV